MYFPWLEVYNEDPEAYNLFHFIKSISKLCSVGTFKENVAENRVEYLGRQFFGHMFLPH